MSNQHSLTFTNSSGVAVPVSSANPLPINSASAGSANNTKTTLTQTVVAVSTTSSTLIAANANRKYLKWMVVGAQSVTIAPGASAVVYGSGVIYQAGSGANTQGAAETFDAVVSTDAFQVICSSGTSTVIVWEGN